MAPTAVVITFITLPKTSSIAVWVVMVKSSLPAWRAVSRLRISSSTRCVRPSCAKSTSISCSSSRLNICMAVATGT